MISIILVEPKNSGNVGAIARTMANFGFSKLILVNPKCNHLSQTARNRAKWGNSVLKKAKIVKGSAFSVQYPVTPLQPMVQRRLLTIGDAAGQATPIMAEGIRPILEMSVYAGDIIRECFMQNNFSKKMLEYYEKKWWDIFGKDDFWGSVLRHLAIKYFNNQQWDKALKNLDKLGTKAKIEFVKSNFSFSMISKIASYKDFLRITKEFINVKWNRSYVPTRRKIVSDFV